MNKTFRNTPILFSFSSWPSLYVSLFCFTFFLLENRFFFSGLEGCLETTQTSLKRWLFYDKASKQRRHGLSQIITRAQAYPTHSLIGCHEKLDKSETGEKNPRKSHSESHTCNLHQQVANNGAMSVCVSIPLFAVLAHTHSSSVTRGWVTAGTLTNLEADTAAGAARRPAGPGSPCSVSMEMQRGNHHV